MVARELKRFLDSTTPEVICIRGRWGVGKTFAWNKALKEAATEKKIALGSYSYVSLFGVSNLDQLKYAIFESRATGGAIANEADNKTLTKNFSDTITALGPKVLETLTGKGGTEIVQAAAFLSIRNQIICIDDIERKGKDLRLRDVLGLVSMLRERRNCKIVIILNDEQLDEEDDWRRYNEKVIERSLLFFPTCEEAVGIALNDNKLFGPLLASNCIRLDISNIRVVKRIERLVGHLHPLFTDCNPSIFESHVKSLALLGWAHFSEFDRSASSTEEKREEFISFILRRHGAGLYGGTRTKNEEEERWEARLKMYDFGTADEADLLLNDGIANGYFNEERLRELAKEKSKDLKQQKASLAWAKTWDFFHKLFDDNAEKFITKLERSFKRALNVITPIDVDSTVQLLKELGRPELAQDLLARYISRRAKMLQDLDLDTYVFRDRMDQRRRCSCRVY